MSKIRLSRGGTRIQTHPAGLRPGDVIAEVASVERIPAGVTIGYEHPVYRSPLAAVRVAIADGSLHWEVTGRGSLQSTRKLLGSVRYAPVTVLAVHE